MSRSLIALLLATMIAGCDRQSPAPEQAAPAASPAPIAAIDRSHKGEAAPKVTFKDAGGKMVTIADFRGRPVLVNLWATWCAPCVAEMPTLDALAARSGAKLMVLPISQDLGGAAQVTPFWAKRGFKSIKPYVDDQGAFGLALGANLPTTILYDREGRELWRVSGGDDWASPAAAKLIAEAGL